MFRVAPAKTYSVFVVISGLLTSGCSTNSVNKTAYETLQNIGQQQCQKTMSSDCSKRESYDDYQRHRHELESPDK
jgi:hypothetical protein